MSSSAIKSVVALLVVLLAVAGMLIKFDKMPGVHLQGGAGGGKLGGGGGGSGGGADSGGAGGGAKADDLRLCGLSGSPQHRLAIINNQTFQEGETARVEFSGAKVKVRCKEIRTNSVLVQWEGANGPVELFLGGKRPDNSEPATATAGRPTTNLDDHAAAPDRTTLAAPARLPGERVGVISAAVPTNVTAVQVEEALKALEVSLDGPGAR